MDRALDPDDLADALGLHEEGPLPRVEELTSLIAGVEVEAFLTPGQLDPQLLLTAWYLHGIASARDAAEFYTPVRQRRAFAVSAHIFDIALQAPETSTHDQLVYAFAAQVGYHRSDLDPNATAIYRRVSHLLAQAPDAAPSDPDGSADYPAENRPGGETGTGSGPAAFDEFASMAIRVGVSFLGLNLRRTDALVRRWENDAGRVASVLEVVTLEGTMYGPAAAVVSAVADLTAFLRFGLRNRLETARASLVSVIDRRAGRGDHDARWVAAHLLLIADGLEESSVWSVLPPDAPDALAQAFAFGAPPVLTLWPPQRELLARNRHNPLDPTVRRLLLSVPTSAGKTLMAQILICHHLATRQGDVCYVTPLRSLGREMRQALAARLQILDKGLVADLPDFATMSLDDLLSSLAPQTAGSVEIMTPERLAHALRRDPAGVLDRFQMFVIDEAHMMAQPGRGLLLEELLATLHSANATLVLLSAVMGNGAQVATWLDDSSHDVLFTSPWRGPRRLHALLYSRREVGQDVVTDRRSKTHPVKRTTPVFGELRVRPAESHERTLRTSTIGHQVRHEGPTGWKVGDGGTAFYRQCARAATGLLKGGSLLMIVTQRDYARDAALEMASELSANPDGSTPEVSTETIELADFLIERLGDEHPLIRCIRSGVAYHHAGLPVDVLDAVEQAIREERLRAVVATTTLTEGVNLPVRTVLVAETQYPGQDPAQQLNAAQLLNAVGRAGRAGRETEGWVVLAIQRPGLDDFALLRPADEDLAVTTTLNTEGAITRLAEAEDLLRESADSLFQLKSGEAAEFVSWVWFILSATERLRQVDGDVSDLRGAISGMLAFTQMDQGLTDRWLELARQAGEVYEQTSTASRHRWVVAGTSLHSARILERVAVYVADRAIADYEQREPAAEQIGVELAADESLSLLHDCDVFKTVLGLPEAERKWTFRPTPRGRGRIDVDVTLALSGWMAGLDVPALAATMLPTVTPVGWRLEQTVDAISGAFEHLFAWTIGIVVETANTILAEGDHQVALAPNIAPMIRYGVDTDHALALMLGGVGSRRVANLVGHGARSRGIGRNDVRPWLDQLHLDGWRSEFAASPREVADLAAFVRAPGVSLLRQVLERGTGVVDLREPMNPLPSTPMPVVVREGEAHLAYEVWATGITTYRVGLIAAHHHSDLTLLLSGGIPLSASTEGETVTLRRV